VTEAAVRPREAARLAALLLRIAQGPREGRRQPAVAERRGLAIPGARSTCDLYEPRGRAPDRAVVAVHGVTAKGGRDPRLMHFARCLARAGVSCLVPTLAGLSDCRFDERDVDDLCSLAVDAARRSGRAAGLVGFSYGASYCLVAAGRQGAAGAVGYVVSFGAYHSLADLLEGYRRDARRPPASARERDDRRYLRLVLAHGLRELSAAPGPDPESARSLLRRFCHEATEEEKRSFDEGAALSGIDVEAVLARALAERGPTVAALSPAESGALARIRCPVSLVHDAVDGVVPPAHSRRIHAALLRHAAPGGARRHTVLVTGLLSHVTLADAARPRDLLRLLAALAPVVAG
jgi:pimeloyl-ACP methyl ester carboxylesterase